MRYKYLLLNILILLNLTTTIFASQKLEKVSVQLQWLDQFQFAGYYIAKEKGFYKDVGLDVEIKKFDYGINPIEEVVNKKSTYGVGRTSLIINKSNGKDIKLLSAIFQSSPFVLIAREDSNIKTIKDFENKKMMVTTDASTSASLYSMIQKASVNKNTIVEQTHTFNLDDLIDKRTDLMASYISNEPFILNKKRIKYTIFDPKDYGFDFYSDLLFTCNEEIKNHKQRAMNFKNASLKGWKYAFDNIDETVTLMLKKYNSQNKSYDALMYEALELKKLAYYQTKNLGKIDKHKLQRIYDIYNVMGLIKNQIDTNSLIVYDDIYKMINFTKEEINYINKKKIVTISMLNNFKPFSFVEQYKHQGLSVDILEKISTISGLEFDIKLSYWSKALNSFKENKVDMISGISHTKKRENFALFTEPFYEIPTYIFGLKNDSEYKNNSSLKGKRVGVSKDMFYMDTLKELGINVVQYPSANHKAQALAFGEIDYYLSNYTTGLKAISTQSLTNIKPLDELQSIKKEDLRYAINKDNKILHSIIKKSLNYINKTDMNTFINKWVLQIKENTNNLILTKEEKNWLKNNPMIKVAIMNYWNHDKNGNSIHTDYLKLLNRYSDLNLVPVRYDAWKDGYSEVISDNNLIHGIMNLAWSKEREEKYFNYTKGYIFEPSFLVVRKENTNILNLQNLKNKIVLSKEKSITDNIIKDISDDIKIIPIKSDNMMYKRIYNDKNIDAFITYKKNDKLLEKYNLKVSQTIYGKYSESSIGIKKQYPYLQSIINKIYKVIPKDELSDLQNKIYNDAHSYKAQSIIKNKVNLSKEELKYLKDNPTIKVHNESDWAPYNYNIDGEPYGFSIDYMNLVASKININIEYINGFTWNEFLEKIKKEQIDVMLNIVKTKQREKYLNFTKSYTKAIDAIFTKKTNNNIKTLKDLNGKKLAVIKGFYEENILKKYYPDINLIFVNNSLESLKAVAFGKADATISSFGVGNYLINQYNISNVKPVFEISDEKFSLDLNLATNKKNTMLRDILNKGMEAITQDEILTLKNKWISNNTKQNNFSINMTREEKKYLEDKQIITMCIDPNWMPFEKIENGKHIGLASEYIKIVEEAINIPIKLIQTKSWNESIKKAQNRECDIFSMVPIIEKRKKYMDFTSPYLDIPMVIATKINNQFIDSITHILYEKIAIVENYSIETILRKKYPNINIVNVKSIDDGLQKVESGKVFAFIDNLATINYAIQKSFIGTVKVSGRLDNRLQYRIATRNDEPILNKIFEKVINNIDTGTKEAIFHKWINSTKKEEVINYTLVWQISILTFFILFASIFWHRKLSKLNHALEIAKNRAEEASKAKSNFLANISHEIRTPMNAIMGMTYIIQKTQLDIKQKDYMNKIETSSNILLKLLNDILDYSKIEADKLTLDKIDFNLKNILVDIESIITFSIEEKGLDFSINYDDNLPLNLYGDSLRLSQVLTNLLSNAIKFTNKGSVRIDIEQISTNKFQFTISDTGIGLNSTQIDKLFNSFTQADESTTRKFGGTGLGLTICKSLVELMNGKIWIESQEGVGSKFIFNIELTPIDKKVKLKKGIDIQIKVNSNNIKKQNVSQQIIDKLFNDLKESSKKRRPALCKPILDELNLYNLNEEDKKLFLSIKQLFSLYKFNDMNEKLNER